MKRLTGNILDAEHGIICHQVNCQLVMGAGLAKQIRDKYPHVYSEYRAMQGYAVNDRLGLCQIVEVKPKTLYVANLFGQFHFRPRNIRHTDYGALAKALRDLANWRRNNCPPNFPIWIPFKMGCGLAGGDWNEVEALISYHTPDAFIIRYVQ